MGQQPKQQFTEQIEVVGNQLVDTIKRLIDEGDARHVTVRDQHGKELASIPLNAGVLGGGVLALAAPGLLLIGGIAALATQVKIEVVRDADPGHLEPGSPEPTGTADPTAPNDEGLR